LVFSFEDDTLFFDGETGALAEKAAEKAIEWLAGEGYGACEYAAVYAPGARWWRVVVLVRERVPAGVVLAACKVGKAWALSGR